MAGAVQDIRVLSGCGRTGPFRLTPVFLRQLKEMACDGAKKLPAVGWIDEVYR